MKKDKEYLKSLLILILFFLFLGIICFILYKPMMEVLKNTESVKQILQEYGILGRMIVVSIMALQVIFIFLPGEIVEILAGLLYGPLEGLILCMLGVVLGSLFIYMLVKRFGICVVDKLIGMKKLNEVSFLQDKKYLSLFLFIIYFIPGTPKDILTYFIPFTDVSFIRFLIITTLARVPSIITSTISGNALGLKQYELSFLVFVITAFLSLLGISLYKHCICPKKDCKNS